MLCAKQANKQKSQTKSHIVPLFWISIYSNLPLYHLPHFNPENFSEISVKHNLLNHQLSSFLHSCGNSLH